MSTQQTEKGVVKHFVLTLIIGSFSLLGCSRTNDTERKAEQNEVKTPAINHTYISSFPHDTTSFTEGFLVHEGKLYESTGSPEDLPQAKSLIGIVNRDDGSIETKIELQDQKLFGEGIVFLNQRLYHLTYKNKIGFIYDAKTFSKLEEFTFPSREGWGMTTDGRSLIMSDGTDVLTYLDPQTLQVVKKVLVTENDLPKSSLNELEYIGSFIYANVWPTNKIIRINPVNGKVTGEMDLTSFASHAKSVYAGALEMNGIAYDSASNTVFVTGKFWPKIFEIRID